MKVLSPVLPIVALAALFHETTAAIHSNPVITATGHRNLQQRIQYSNRRELQKRKSVPDEVRRALGNSVSDDKVWPSRELQGSHNYAADEARRALKNSVSDDKVWASRELQGSHNYAADEARRALKNSVSDDKV
ncbi:hypothetical protein As57867_023782, partial [Aphanomyces stellatus]